MDVSAGERPMDEESEAVKSKAPSPRVVRILNVCCYQAAYAWFAVLGRDIGGFNFDLFRRFALRLLCLCSFVAVTCFGWPCFLRTLRRNQLMLGKTASAPRMKKTGTTIVGVTFKVRFARACYTCNHSSANSLPSSCRVASCLVRTRAQQMAMW